MSEPVHLIQLFDATGVLSIALSVRPDAPSFIPAIHQALADCRWRANATLSESLGALTGAYYLMTSDDATPYALEDGLNRQMLVGAITGQPGLLTAPLEEDTLWLVPHVPKPDRVLRLRALSDGDLELEIHDIELQQNPIRVDWIDVVEQTGGNLKSFWDLLVDMQWESLERCSEQSKIKRLPAGSGAW